MKAVSILSTNTFKGAAIALLGGLAPIGVNCVYENRSPTQTEAIATVALVCGFASTMVGRVQTTPVYTPDGLPGPSKKDLET